MLKMFDQLEYFIKQNKNNKIKIVGFTEDIGIYDYNLINRKSAQRR